MRILLVDDEPLIRLSVGDALRAASYDVRLASDGAEALRLLEDHRFDVVICDVRLPKVDGLTVFKHIRRAAPKTHVILITAFGTVTDAVGALKDGATDYLSKPFEIEQLLGRLELIARQKQLERELSQTRAALAAQTSGSVIVGQSPQMASLFERIDTFADSDAPVLILGESGTGKELVARTLHERSSRRDKAFVAVNCAAFPETLLEAELFGHERGAFTGAVARREGRFKAADGGTLLLDEVAEMPLPMQVKLLRALQEGVVEPLGTNQAIKVNVRIISATHRKLKDFIGEGKFREDLYYRLKVLDLHIPPLRERRADLPLLAEFFLRKFAPASEQPTLSARTWAAFSQYEFPGNVRELEHAIHHAVILARGKEIDLEHLPSELGGEFETGVISAAEMRPLGRATDAFEREYIRRALQLAGGKKGRAAELLRISRKNLWEKLRAHGLTQADWQETSGDTRN